MDEKFSLEEHKEMENRAKRYLTLASAIALVTILGGILMYTTHCSVGPKDQVAVPPPASAPVCADGSAVGATRNQACPAGQAGTDVQVCTAAASGTTATWVDASNTCGGGGNSCSVTTYADVGPILDKYCSTCHVPPINNVQEATKVAAEISRRINIAAGNSDHMPLATSPLGQPTSQDVALLTKWVTDGANATCPSTGANTGSTITEDYIMTAMVNDATAQNPADRPFIRYLVVGDAINMGASKSTQDGTVNSLKTWQDAINKALNSLNPVGQDMIPAQPVDPQGAVYRFDLRNYNMSAAQIAALDAGDVNINIVDNTSKGLVLQSLIGDKKPWFHAVNFIDVAFRNSDVYYKFLNVPATLAAYQAQLGVNFENDLATLTNVSFIGSNESPIAQHKNRLIVRDIQARATNAYYWQTFDVNFDPSAPVKITCNATAGSQTLSNCNSLVGVEPGQAVAGNGINVGTTVLAHASNGGNNTITLSTAAIQSVRNDALSLSGVNSKNLFQFPLLPGTGALASGQSAQATYTQDASETIVQLPNGMMGFALWDAEGNRLNTAVTNVVIDNLSPVSQAGAINNANSCLRCHSIGMNPFVDQVNAQVSANAAQFTANDVQLVQAVYKGEVANNTLFNIDNNSFAQAMGKINAKVGADPMNVLTDKFLGNWNLQQAAAFLFLTPQQFTQALQESPKSLAAIGQILQPSGTVTFAAFTGTLQQLILDARLFQDPLTQ